jgi:hypothetical protein
MQFLSRLRLWQKLAILVVAMAIPTALVGLFYLTAATQQVDQARLELDGARYLGALGEFNAEMVVHQGLVYTMLSGDATIKCNVSSEES